jgi:peptidoglycan/xylan/chitin deacetylase (PgdA/CDA1 family)
LHDFFELFTSILGDVGGEPVPRIAAWPDGCRWALVLTHDVETAKGFAALDPILELERDVGLRSSWNFVPLRYAVDGERIRQLAADGFEVGVHGLRHDGRDLASLARVKERLPGIREAADQWNAVGFRSPATLRQWELMPLLGFDYDSSYPDTDPFEPHGGGCCTWLPFFNADMVELPLTMPQDHTMFVILGESDETAWISKAELLRDRGGMALIDTHPDYLIDDRIKAAYRRLLERYASDLTAWKALPREVSAWWRRRAASQIERVGEDLVVTGPVAGQARVELVESVPWR